MPNNVEHENVPQQKDNIRRNDHWLLQWIYTMIADTILWLWYTLGSGLYLVCALYLDKIYIWSLFTIASGLFLAVAYTWLLFTLYILKIMVHQVSTIDDLIPITWHMEPNKQTMGTTSNQEHIDSPVSQNTISSNIY
jgi:hypothetical protein